jgi:RimJ/RimL family protein N-acetyltransferase
VTWCLRPRTDSGYHPRLVTDARIELARLVDVPLASVVALLNEPRNTRHMPLSTPFTPDSAREWVLAKDGQWTENGYGPWAVLVGGDFAGLGGFQREPNGADFALVLFPHYWGHGAAITREVLRRGFTELGLSDVLIALPYSRSPDRAVARLGFVSDGEVSYDGVPFRKYRLTREAWAGTGPPQRAGIPGSPR